MKIENRIVVITGGASGIGAALAQQAKQAGATVVVSDRAEEALAQTATSLGVHAIACDVSRESEIARLIDQTQQMHGPIDVFVSNAGFGRGDPGHAASAPDADWMLNWNVHVMAHVWAARALLPGMMARGSGYFVNVASAAGLLNQIGDAAYSATKHAAVSFAESLAITHGRDGIGVSVVCPQYVATPLLGLDDADAEAFENLLTADDVANAVWAAVEKDEFLVLPHGQVRQYAAFRGAEHDAWIAQMQGLRAKAQKAMGDVRPDKMYKLV